MTVRTPTRLASRLARRTTACLGAAALAATSFVLAGAVPAGAAAPLLKSANISNFHGILENSHSYSMYTLSNEKGAKLHCTGSCLASWFPLKVKSSVKAITVAKTVKGKIAFVKRSSTLKQVTFNSFPIYTYIGDTPNQSNGEGITSNGGVWHLVHASAKSPGATPFAPVLNKANTYYYANVLATNSSASLYVLSVEKGASLKCTGSCLTTWPPLLVPSSASSVSMAPGVKGAIGFVTRGAMKQVTFNTYPVYTYSGDSSPNQSCGENVPAFGGRWTLASASATTAAATPVPPVGSGGCYTGGRYSRPSR